MLFEFKGGNTIHFDHYDEFEALFNFGYDDLESRDFLYTFIRALTQYNRQCTIIFYEYYSDILLSSSGVGFIVALDMRDYKYPMLPITATKEERMEKDLVYLSNPYPLHAQSEPPLKVYVQWPYHPYRYDRIRVVAGVDSATETEDGEIDVTYTQFGTWYSPWTDRHDDDYSWQWNYSSFCVFVSTTNGSFRVGGKPTYSALFDKTNLQETISALNRGKYTNKIAVHSDSYPNDTGYAMGDFGELGYDVRIINAFNVSYVGGWDITMLDMLDLGLVNVYETKYKNGVQSLADFLWSHGFFDSILKTQNDAFSAIMALRIMPYLPDDAIGDGAAVKVGNTVHDDTTLQAIHRFRKVTKQYYTKDLGHISIPHNNADYTDYKPYSSAEIYLPFVGIVPLDINDVIGKSIGIKYIFDVLSGNFIAVVSLSIGKIYKFNGNCSAEIPVTGENAINLWRSFISNSFALVGASATGNIPMFTVNGAMGALNIASASSSVMRSGSLNGNLGYFGPENDYTPYVILHMAKNVTPTLDRVKGKCYYRYQSLEDLTGFTQCSAVHIVGGNATEEERKEIEDLLKEGVYL